MCKCLICGEPILTQLQFFIEPCDYAIIKGSSHEVRKNELQVLNQIRNNKK